MEKNERVWGDIVRIIRSRPIFYDGRCCLVLTMRARNAGKDISSRCVSRACECSMCSIPTIFRDESVAIVDEMIDSACERDTIVVGGQTMVGEDEDTNDEYDMDIEENECEYNGDMSCIVKSLQKRVKELEHDVNMLKSFHKGEVKQRLINDIMKGCR